jgi:hypothetical protein
MHRADGPPLDEPSRPSVEVKTPAVYERIMRFRSKYLARQAIPSFAALMSQIEKRQRLLDDTAEQATQAVVEDLERAAASINLRTAPLVPTCGLVVAGAGVPAVEYAPSGLLRTRRPNPDAIYWTHDRTAAAAGAAAPQPRAILRPLPERDAAPTPRLAGTGRGRQAGHGTAKGYLRGVHPAANEKEPQTEEDWVRPVLRALRHA